MYFQFERGSYTRQMETGSFPWRRLNGRQRWIFLVPLPPLAEQRRIVAKVEQLMALVDAIETQLAASRDKGHKLLEAVISELTLTS